MPLPDGNTDYDNSEKDILMTDFVSVAKATDLGPGQMVLVEIDDEEIVVANANGEYYAFSAECPHAGGPLDEGEMEGKVVICPWHGAEFDMTTGEALTPPVQDNIYTYTVRIEGEDVQVSLE